MKRTGHLIEPIADMDNLRLAFWKAGKGKRYSRQVLRYAANLEPNLLRLQKQILAAEVNVGNYHYFKIHEPKERQICASAFSEQVLHHALMNVCHPYFERYQIYDSYASRKGKGVYAAMERAKVFTRKYPLFLKLDVKKFFDSIDHCVLKSQLARLFKDPRLLSIFTQVIDSYRADVGRGVPIGNLTSQYFANHFLAGLDHYVKEKLQCKAYVRYMDDMLCWADEKEQLRNICKAIEQYLNHELHCGLKPVLLNTVDKGLPFLGYRLSPTGTRLLHKSKVRFIRKLDRAARELEVGLLSEQDYQRRVLPLLAFIKKADTHSFRKSMLTLRTDSCH